DAFDHVVHVDVIRMDVDMAQALDQQLHAFGFVVNAADEHRLVAHENAALEEHRHRLLRDPRDLFGCVEVRVQYDIFAERTSAVDDAYKCVHPGRIREQLHRHD